MHVRTSIQKFTAKTLTATLLCSAVLGLFNSSPVLASTSTYLSPVITAPQVFTGLGASWDQKLTQIATAAQNDTAEISVRFEQQVGWSNWYPLDPDLDGKEESDPTHPTAFLPVNPTQNYQYKISNNTVENLKFTYVNSTDFAKQNPYKVRSTQNPASQASQGTLLAASVLRAKNTTPSIANQVALDTNLTGIHIISRSEWGADESLRLYKSSNPKPVIVKTENDYETKFANELKIIRTVETDGNGKDLTWPQQYPEKISKIIIHHTATSKTLDDPMRAIRDIYYFHTVSRGWGDIGYNYIIDQQGNIYEGRAGGETVVGAHSGRGNVGSIGIAVLGNYMESEVPEPVVHSLVALIQAKTQQYNIDPLGSSLFRGENLQNVMGHRDIMSTSCPGEKLYAQLSGIRLSAKSGFKPLIIDRGKNLKVNQDYDFQVAQDIPLFTFDPGEEKELILNLKNSGSTSWNKDTNFIVNRDANANNFFLSQGVVQSGTTGRDIQPGDSAIFKIKIRAGYKGGFTALEVFPMVNGKIKVEKYLSMPIVIKPAILDYQLISLTVPKPFLKINEQVDVRVELKNTGNITWSRDGLNAFTLGTDKPRDHLNNLLIKPSNRLAHLQEKEVKPGETGHLNFKIKAPKNSGQYNEYFTPVLEGIGWMENRDNHLELYVYEKEIQGILAGSSNQTPPLPGEQKTIWFEVKNVGGVIWNKSGENSMNFEVKNINKLQMEGPTMQQEKVAPGEIAHISFTVTAPLQTGFNLIQVRPKIGKNYVLPQVKNYFFNIPKNSVAIPAIVTSSPSPSSSLSQQNPVQLTSVATNIRIGLSYRGNPVITGSGPFHAESNNTTIASFNNSQTATVSYENNQYNIKSGDLTLTSITPPRFIPEANTILQIQNWNQTYNKFRGVLEPHWYNNELITINELPIEDYLKGTGETKDSQPYEKLKAVMVVSRSYALFYVQIAKKFPGAPFNLKDDPQTSQKYVGYSAEKNSPNTLKAITDTSGEVVTYQGKLIKTPYFSGDDGRTRSAQEVWGWKDTPYLVSVSDPYCKGMAMNGHGVGLSGCGSLGMSQNGKTYQEIIKYYYTGVEIQKL